LAAESGCFWCSQTPPLFFPWRGKSNHCPQNRDLAKTH
jgi:hypothetical protein